MIRIEWTSSHHIGSHSYICGYCNHQVGPNIGYTGKSGASAIAVIAICSYCHKPTFLYGGEQTPSKRMGEDIKNISDESIKSLYMEARDCTSVKAYTSAALVCRKIIMHIAVDKGANPGEKFITYIDYLENNHFFPPNGRAWVDSIRKKGNEATHEIKIVNKVEAEELIHFTEFLLRFIYEMPSYVAPANAQPPATQT